MIRILAHGVPCAQKIKNNTVCLSPMQQWLRDAPEPIRICGAPTGAGKSFAFFHMAYLGQWILFVVPTQALAENLYQHAQSLGIYCPPPWDGRQSKAAKLAGKNIWIERYTQLDQVRRQGGVIITTPETLGQIFLGQPYRHTTPIPELDMMSILSAAHIVFDEAHTLTERAWGFISAWLWLIVEIYRNNPENFPRINFLSATHSGMLHELIQNVPNAWVGSFDEQIVSGTTLDSTVRWLHGQVEIEPYEESLSELINQQLSSLLATHRRILIIFDSLKEYVGYSAQLAQLIDRCELHRQEVFAITGQDRQVSTSLDHTGFASGTEPLSHHRVIVGTSAIELGITYEGVTAALMDSGRNTAALLQRIGRVARGHYDGTVYVARGTKAYTHFQTLQSLNDQTLSIQDFRRAFIAGPPLVPINFRRARALGHAYWSMMRSRRAPVVKALDMIGRQHEIALWGAQLDSLRKAYPRQLPPNAAKRYAWWLKRLDSSLTDVRDFSPSLSLQFADLPPIEYSREWALRYLCEPDDIDMDRWIYRKPRNACLLDTPRQKIRVSLVLPWPQRTKVFELSFGDNGKQKLIEKYCEYLSFQAKWHRPIVNDTLAFIRSTGLLVVDNSDEEVDEWHGSFIL